MSIHNSLPCELYVALAKTICTKNDIRAIRKRYSVNFITKELPALGKAIDTSLSTGVLDFSDCRFRPAKGTQIPLMFNKLFIKVYQADGTLRAPLCAESLRNLRILTYFFYKLESEPTKAQELQSYEKFILTDNKVKEDFTEEQFDLIRPFVQAVMPDMIGELIPEHGSGAVCEHLSNHEKIGYRAVSSDDTLSLSWDYMNRDHAAEHSADIDYHSYTAKYINVPKDSRGPRGIALQPTRLMSYQKALMRILYDFIETASPAKGFINFTDQTINQRLAREASLDQKYCTIDLKDASDLVSWALVKEVVSDEWLDMLSATRCTEISIGDDILPLKKFASMGSALCFPIEAIVFWSIAQTVCNEVYVYGDDIIVPNQHFHTVCQALHDFGLMVNVDKSLYKGYFRESCGGDYYYGNSIAPIRLKKLDSQNVIACANLLHSQGYIEAADNIVNVIEENDKQTYQRGEIDDEVRPFVYNNGRTSSNHVFFKKRWNKDFQFTEIRVPTLTSSNIPLGEVSQYDLYYEYLRSNSVVEKEHKPNDWYGAPAGHCLVKARPGYKWVPLRD